MKKIIAQHPDTLVPKDGEPKDNFMSRCMTNEQMQQDFDQGQRQNQCQLIWSKYRDPDVSEITLFGTFGEEITAARLKMELDEIDGDVDINLFSGGGDLFEAAAMVGLIEQRKKENRVRIFVHGLAASAGAYFAVSANMLIMEESAMLMIHNAWTIATGDKNDLRDVADRIEKQQKSMVDKLMQKSGKDRDEIESMLDEETWMTAAEAVSEGFADAVFQAEDEEKVAASVTSKQAKDFKRIPESVKVTGKQKPQSTNQSDIMNKALINACNLKADADESDVLAFISDLKAEKKALEGQVETLKADKDDLEETNEALKEQNEDLKETNEALEESTKEQKVDAVIDEVIEAADGVKLGDEAMQGLRRRAQRHVDESDEDRKADIKEDMVIFAKAKGVKAGRTNITSLPSQRKDHTENSQDTPESGGFGYEKKLQGKIDEVMEQNPEMSFAQAKRQAENALKSEKRNGADPRPHSDVG